MTTFGIIGAGNIGSQVARAVIAQGNDVVIANSRGPETLGDLVAELGPRARAATVDEAAAAAEVAVVTIPLKAIEDIPASPLAGKILIDTNNYYWERDGRIAELDEGRTTTSEIVQRHFADAGVSARDIENLAQRIDGEELRAQRSAFDPARFQSAPPRRPRRSPFGRP